jgi:uncharacterized membrane protein
MQHNVLKRIAAIDILRGLAMIVMALDHTRDYFTNYTPDPLDLEHLNIGMFFTRWVTHFCAPVFIFLAGTSAFLSAQKQTTKKQAAIFLLKRGLWLVLLELTILKIGWEFSYAPVVALQVFWAIGWSMVFLSALIFLPLRWIAVIPVLLIFGHNAFDGLLAENMGNAAGWWRIIHQPGPVHPGPLHLYVVYPLIPWIGVMSAGYCFGKLMIRDAVFRNFWCYIIGSFCILVFIILRWSNLYGDTHPWHPQNTWWMTILDFIRCEKYPPSLLFLLMTLGPAILSIPFLEKLNRSIARVIEVYGRVPLFFYILHVYLIHTLALLAGLVHGFPASYFTDVMNFVNHDGRWGFSLGWVIFFWVVVVALLYYPCKWFMSLKQQNRNWWLSYL